MFVPVFCDIHVFKPGYSFKYPESGAATTKCQCLALVCFLNSKPQRGGSCSQGLRNVRRGFFTW